MKFNNREVSWRDLLPGTITLIALLAAATYILTSVGIGNLPGRKFRIYALTEQARGILRGSDVWLAGIRAGSISSIDFLPVSSGGQERIVLGIDILESHRHLVRKDSRAEIRGGTRLIGNPVLQVRLGGANAPAITDGDTLGSIPQFDPEIVAEKVQEVMYSFPAVIADLQVVLRDASALSPRLGELFSRDAQGPLAFRALVASLGEIAESFEQGSAGLLLADTAIRARLQSITSSGDSIMSMVGPGSGGASRYLSDGALVARLDSLAGDFQRVLMSLEQSSNSYLRGARAVRMQEEMDRLTASLAALRADARKRPLRYIIF